jgi:uncharacterized protein YjbI with pentapeptide repeats
MGLDRRSAILAIAFGTVSQSARAADIPLRLLVETLFNARPDSRPNFSGRDLSMLDLSDLDFKGADLAGANLLGANLSGANLAGVNLSRGKLDRTQLTRTNFTNADLSYASLYHAFGSLNLESQPADAPNFSRANLRGVRIMARLPRANMSGADLTDARLDPPERGNELKTPQQTDLSGASLKGARLVRANLVRVNLSFADLSNADLTGADLTGADLARANLSGADVAGANFGDAHLYETNLAGVRGSETSRGLSTR